MPITLDAAALNMALALICGALIGSERQVRQRMAGVRTNALVALAAAGFVVFSGLYPDELSPTRVGAQVVTGIGFLGAGIIFRNGFTIHGLNTAATLWCSAAVGILAGGGALTFAIALTLMIVFVNLGLRPVVKWIKRRTRAGMPMALDYRIVVTTVPKHEGKVRGLVLQKLSFPGAHVNSIESSGPDATGEVTLDILASVEDRDDTMLRSAITPLTADARVHRLGWESSAEG